MPRDPEKPAGEVAIRDFPGIKNAVDIHELVDGSSHDQVNATGEDIGCLRSRRGYAICLFDGE